MEVIESNLVASAVVDSVTKSASKEAVTIVKVPLDEKMYSLKEEEIEFYKQQTGIQDDEELKQHVLAVQKEAYDVYQYISIRSFNFMRLGIYRLKAYPDLLKLGKERPGAIFLDFACCFGCDLRKAIADGYPMQNVIASDVQPDFWRLGHNLFRTTPSTFPVPLIPGDVFDPQHIAPTGPIYTPPQTPPPSPSLHTLTSLNPLRGHVSCIFTGAFFHLFNHADQLTAARALASLLSPEPGSFIFGFNAAKVPAREGPTPAFRSGLVFWPSPESWRGMWDGEVFERGTVEVYAEIEESKGGRSGSDMKQLPYETRLYRMEWYVKRK